MNPLKKEFNLSSNHDKNMTNRFEANNRLLFGKPLTNTIDTLNRTLGCGCAALLVFMVITNTLIVLLRYGIHISTTALQELLIYFHSIVFLLAAPLALQNNHHVRIDVVYSKLPAKQQIWITRLGILLFLWPFCTTVFILSWPYVMFSWQLLEHSAEPGGLPTVYLLKSLLLIFPVLLALQGLSEWLKTNRLNST